MCESTENKKRYLRRYLEAEYYIRCLEEDLNMEISAYTLRSQRFDDMPHASGSNSADLANMAVKFDEMMAEIRREVARKYAIKQEIITRINRMDNEREKSVLYYRYIHGLEWDEIGKRMYYSVKHVQRIHGSALLHF